MKLQAQQRDLQVFSASPFRWIMHILFFIIDKLEWLHVFFQTVPNTIASQVFFHRIYSFQLILMKFDATWHGTHIGVCI